MNKPINEIEMDPKICDHLINALQTHEMELQIKDDALFYISRTGSITKTFSEHETTNVVQSIWGPKQDIFNASITFATHQLLEATWKWIQEMKQYRNSEAYLLETDFLIHILKKGYKFTWVRLKNELSDERIAEIMAMVLSTKEKCTP